MNYTKLDTEKVNTNTLKIDLCNTEDMLLLINQEDKKVALAVEKEIPHITEVVEAVFRRLQTGGRIFYIGAGTSGRIGILDASECPPTFGVSPELVQGIIAGGPKAIQDAVEGAEDQGERGITDIADRCINEKDAVIGISASGSAPYVVAAIQEAKARGALTVGLCNTLPCTLALVSGLYIAPIVGPEVISGSTRMKAGTSQKMVLNMISTTVMIKMGKVYQNLMVDLAPSNSKLKDRACRIVCLATGANEKLASQLLETCSTKEAIVCILCGCDRQKAADILKYYGGYIRPAIENQKGINAC